jgi:hypothetical protein
MRCALLDCRQRHDFQIKYERRCPALTANQAFRPACDPRPSTTPGAVRPVATGDDTQCYDRLCMLRSLAVHRVDLQHGGGDTISPRRQRAGGVMALRRDVYLMDGRQCIQVYVAEEVGRATHSHARHARGGVRLAGCAVSTSLAHGLSWGAVIKHPGLRNYGLPLMSISSTHIPGWLEGGGLTCLVHRDYF